MKKLFILLLMLFAATACTGADTGISGMDSLKDPTKPNLSSISTKTQEVFPSDTPQPAFPPTQTETLVTLTAAITETKEPVAVPQTKTSTQSLQPTQTETGIPTVTVIQTETPTGICLVEYDQGLNLALFDQLNVERAKHGLGEFTFSNDMKEAVDVHSEDLLCGGASGHTGSDGSTPRDRADRLDIYFADIQEFIREGTDSLEVLNELLEDYEFYQVLTDQHFRFVGMTYAYPPGNRDAGIFVLVFYTQNPQDY